MRSTFLQTEAFLGLSCTSQQGFTLQWNDLFVELLFFAFLQPSLFSGGEFGDPFH